MKCPCCGRVMLDMGTYFKCSNGFCDYEEDFDPSPVNLTQLPESNNPKPAAA